MSHTMAALAEDLLDPEIREFVSRMTAGFSQFPPFDSISHAEARDVAEAVRRPWRQGGPTMASINERQVPTPHGLVRIRVYDPGGDAGPAGKPALIYLHGGGWTLFSLDTHDRVMREYAGRAGLVVVGVDYALSPEVKFPVALEQVAGVVGWLRAHGQEIGVDPEKLAVGGDSAGGNLSAGVALFLRDQGQGRALKAMLLNYAVVEAVCSDDANRRFGGAGFMLGDDEMRQFWVNYLRTPEDAENPLACPMRASLAGLPPAFLTIAECDVLAEQNIEFARRMNEAGVEAKAAVYQGATHSFLEAVSISSLADRALQDGSDWLKDRLA